MSKKMRYNNGIIELDDTTIGYFDEMKELAKKISIMKARCSTLKDLAFGAVNLYMSNNYPKQLEDSIGMSFDEKTKTIKVNMTMLDMLDDDAKEKMQALKTIGIDLEAMILKQESEGMENNKTSSFEVPNEIKELFKDLTLD